MSQKLRLSPDNEGLNIKACILAARTLNVPLFYGDTWPESKIVSRTSNTIRPSAFLFLQQSKLWDGYAPLRLDTILHRRWRPFLEDSAVKEINAETPMSMWFQMEQDSIKINSKLRSISKLAKLLFSLIKICLIFRFNTYNVFS